MDRFLLGKEIKRRRVELKLTQKQLAEGICKQSIISKIENGELFPSFEIIVALSNRLKLSVSYLLESAICEQFHLINDIKEELDFLLLFHKHQYAFNIAEKVLETNKFLFGEHRQYLVWARTVAAFATKKMNYDEAISVLKSCLDEKMNYFNQNQRMLICNSIATINAYSGRNEEALNVFEELFLKNKNEPHTFLYLQVLFNYANTLHNYSHFDKALLIVNEALLICKKFENTRMMGKLYFLKGECLIDLGYTKVDISKCFEKALFFFDLLHHDDYIKILWDMYSEYL